MICNLLAAALAGIFIPLTLARYGFDPAVASGVFVTMVTDVVGFFAFLGLASLWLRSLASAGSRPRDCRVSDQAHARPWASRASPAGMAGMERHEHRGAASGSPGQVGWLKLFKGYIEFYKASVAERGDREDLAPPAGRHSRLSPRAGGGDAADTPGRPGARAVSSLDLVAELYCYLEDLFVDPARRKTGAGRALIEAIYREADARGARAPTG